MMTIDPTNWIDLSGKVAHVTGGAMGIGQGIARALAAAGAKVAVSDVDGEGARRTAEEIGGHAITLDVSDRAAFEAALDETAAKLGGLDILVNNAGVYNGLAVRCAASLMRCGGRSGPSTWMACSTAAGRRRG